mgnify:CR=1 FL=1
MSENQVNKDGDIKILFNNNKLKAFLEIVPPLGEGKVPTEEDVLKKVAELNIVDVKNDAIKEALLEKNWGEKFLIAEGRSAIDGVSAKVEFKFPSLAERLGPKIDAEGIADYHNLGLVYNVKMGEVLAIKTPATEGTPGADVTGKEIPAKKGVDLRIPLGKNTICDENETRVLAAIDGNVNVRDSKIVVVPVFDVNGDLDFSIGNIDFVGDVIINGNVNTGFMINAGGNIEVKGFVEGAKLLADGDIIIRGGITTGHKGLVKANGDISARFVENSQIEAGGDVIVREAIMQSLVKAGRNVKVTDRKATILGGTVQAAEEVESRVIGSQLATKTTIEVGVNPHYREELYVLNKERNEKRLVMDNLNHNLQIFQRSGVNPENLTPKRKLALVKMLDNFKNIRKEVKEIEERIIFLENEFNKIQNAKVKAVDIVYPGVRITIGQANYLINDPIKFSAFVLDEGEVRTAALD